MLILTRLIGGRELSFVFHGGAVASGLIGRADGDGKGDDVLKNDGDDGNNIITIVLLKIIITLEK